MKPLLVIGLFAFLCAIGCKGRDVEKGNGAMQPTKIPVAIASGYSTENSEVGLELTLYGVKDKVAGFSLNAQPAGRVLVYCSDDRFLQNLGYHFADMNDPKAYVGSTMFISFDPTGVPIELWRVTPEHKAERAFSNKCAIVYFQVGDKGNLIRVIPTR